MKTQISRTQEGKPKHSQRKVEVYDFELTSRIPTVIPSTHWFLYELMGNEARTIIMSPTGGVANKRYGKPLNELERDSPTGSGSYSGEEPNKLKYTEEDTERFWLLKSSEFRKELTQMGWMIFPEIEKLDESDLKRFDLGFGDWYQRSFSLANLVKGIELTNDEGFDYGNILQDFKELMPFADNIEFIYRAHSDGDGSFFHLPVKYKDTDLILKLTDLECVSSPEKGESNTMRRHALFEVKFSDDFLSKPPAWWTDDISGRILSLTRSYLEKQGIESKVRSVSIEKENKLDVDISNRDYFDKALEPNTGILLEKALSTKQFVEKAVKIEHENYKVQQTSILKGRKEVLGIAEQ
ncbi:hypothetical protein KY348_04780 [Candidatus Woesearchaeota archaeon]|nr:hypothetical protein [Candidatus Woesearchaeota archaeon]